MENKKIRSFTDLIVWQKAHKLILDVYLITKKFPIEERFGLCDQLRRASVSITSNIVEGFYRRTKNDKTHFYYLALSSLAEVRNQLLIAKDLYYITYEKFQGLAMKCLEIKKILNGFISSSLSK